ncbi:hypothetical protein NC653_015101 [Populus alba x Populus x berolinensis]|uniref:Uncharacterized protein n=1 Tax=Populus alba x Populus x berolinensis TaxID=444605 RepID=A0AAD6QYP6_9ROSI|nr:hypothetical protein NC653_015101 [Populus alba x Populus x berolinensis]
MTRRRRRLGHMTGCFLPSGDI